MSVHKCVCDVSVLCIGCVCVCVVCVYVWCVCECVSVCVGGEGGGSKRICLIKHLFVLPWVFIPFLSSCLNDLFLLLD